MGFRRLWIRAHEALQIWDYDAKFPKAADLFKLKSKSAVDIQIAAFIEYFHE